MYLVLRKKDLGVLITKIQVWWVLQQIMSLPLAQSQVMDQS